jgi:hypothetical protein
MTDPEVVLARRTLLDALVALDAHRESIILVGAQAIYLHTGRADVALAEYTTDGDLAVDPRELSADPLIESAMRHAGFDLDPADDSPGTWIAPNGVQIDLIVPEMLAGKGRRSAKIPPHDRIAMRRSAGLEAALVDHAPMEIRSFEDDDTRAFTVSVAGPAALLVAKLHKVADRLGDARRLNNKDAHDIYRLLVEIDTTVFAAKLRELLSDPLCSPAVERGMKYLADLFAAGEEARGAILAGAAEEGIGNPAQVALSVSLLAAELRDALG